MPEGDTIFRAARSLHRVLAGHVVTNFETAYAHLDRVNVDTPLIGRTIDKCESAGKHVLMHFSGDLILRTHMRMNGSWHLYRHGERWWRGRQAMRVRIDTSEWVAVAFNVPVAEFVSARQLETRDPVAQLGPDLLGPQFDRDEAVRRIVTSGARPIAMTLLDQRIVAGIGNVYKSEVLFMTGIHPETPSSAVPQQALERLMDLARTLLQDNVVDGASPRIQTYRNLRQLNPATEHDESVWVYGRRGKPCRKCGTPIQMRKMGLEARSTYWCPTCQPPPATPGA
ncbi:MAG TPA: DNA-formamidopyrimidine glycosylase family protein [Vicinamibacterales bacterium]|nr:DNA-formamidopyrimidine glycosylase family protein [Vicinamibacterales bacterium]